MDRITPERAIAVLEDVRAITVGHFIGTSGKHLSVYVQKEAPTRYPHKLRVLARGIAWSVKGLAVDVVVAPPMGALSVGTMVAEELGTEYAFLESEGEDELAIKRPPFLEAVTGRKVGIVEDIFTTGKSTRKSIKAVREANGEVAWVAGIWSHGQVTAANLDVEHFFPLVEKPVEVLLEEECQAHGLCSRGIPIHRRPGHGWQHETRLASYVGGFI